MRIGIGNIIGVNLAQGVSAIEFWQANLIAGRAYGQGVVSPTAAGQSSIVQVFNPVASGINVYIYSATFTPGANSTVGMFTVNADQGGTAATPTPLRTGAPVAKATWKSNTVAALPATIIAEYIVPAVTPIPTPAPWPAVITPGFGFLLGNFSLNTGFTCAIQWLEI